VTVPSTPEEGPRQDRVKLATLKGDARTGYAPTHPNRVAVESLPDEVSRAEFVAQLRILLPLSRVREGQST
jgi:hypothetical protein